LHLALDLGQERRLAAADFALGEATDDRTFAWPMQTADQSEVETRVPSPGRGKRRPSPMYSRIGRSTSPFVAFSPHDQRK
jgi:hypothetical protein